MDVAEGVLGVVHVMCINKTCWSHTWHVAAVQIAHPGCGQRLSMGKLRAGNPGMRGRSGSMMLKAHNWRT